MPRRAVRGGRLRRRLVVAFVAVAAVSAGVLAISSYYLVRDSRLQDSLDRAHLEARVDLSLAAGIRFASGTPDAAQFVQGYELRNVHAVLRFPAGRITSDPRVDPPIPQRLEHLVAAGQLGYTRMDVRGSPYLVIGGQAPDSDGRLYLFFSEAGIHHDLIQLARVLLVGWVAVVVLSGLVGRLLARRTLEPVARASDAARLMAEGLLTTRLPVAGDDEFGRWAASFNDMADALEAKITALAQAEERERRFTSDVAHELRTPLTALVAEASLLRDHVARMPDEVRRPAELLIGDIGRLRTLVEELMEISRLDARSEPVRQEPIELRALVASVLRVRGWEKRVSLQGDELVISSDARRLERIVANLVGNAVEHGGTEIEVALAGDDAARAVVEISDTGPGVAPEHLPHIFERFYKVDRARTGTGSGLGLAIALENARLLGGDITVDSVAGVPVRTRFRLIVPREMAGEAGPGGPTM